MEFFRQEYLGGGGSHFLFQGIFPTQGLKLGLLHLQADSLPSEPPGKPNIRVKRRESRVWGAFSGWPGWTHSLGWSGMVLLSSVVSALKVIVLFHALSCFCFGWGVIWLFICPRPILKVLRNQVLSQVMTNLWATDELLFGRPYSDTRTATPFYQLMTTCSWAHHLWVLHVAWWLSVLKPHFVDQDIEVQRC